MIEIDTDPVLIHQLKGSFDTINQVDVTTKSILKSTPQYIERNVDQARSTCAAESSFTSFLDIVGACRDGQIILWKNFPFPVSNNGGDGEGDERSNHNTNIFRKEKLKNLRICRLLSHTDEVNCVSFSKSGEFIVSGSRDQTVRVWKNSFEQSSTLPDPRSGRITQKTSSEVLSASVTSPLQTYKAHTASVRYVEMNPFSGGNSNSVPHQFLSCSDDKTVKIWDLRTKKFIMSFAQHNNWVRCARYSPSLRHVIASASDDKTINLFDSRVSTSSSSPVMCIRDSASGNPLHVDFHPSGTCLAVGCSDRRVKVYDIRSVGSDAKRPASSGDCLLQAYSSAHKGGVTQVSFHPCGNYLSTSSIDGTVKIFDLLEARPIYELTAHRRPVKSGKFLTSGIEHSDIVPLVTAGQDGKVFIWSTKLPDTSSNKSAATAIELEPSNQGVKNCEKEGPVENNIQKEGLEELQKELNSTKLDLGQANKRIEVLVENVFLMEKRIALLEDQILMADNNNLTGASAVD